MKVLTISSRLNFGCPMPSGSGSAAGRNFLAPPYYSQCAVFVSLWALFHLFVCHPTITLNVPKCQNTEKVTVTHGYINDDNNRMNLTGCLAWHKLHTISTTERRSISWSSTSSWHIRHRYVLAQHGACNSHISHLINSDGVLDDMSLASRILEDNFYSPWPWPHGLCPWTWPRG